MHAIVFDGKKLKFEQNYPEPVPAENEAVIRPLRLGICSTDMEICKGYMAGFNGVLGHEFVGIVESVNGIDNRKLTGKRVVGSINAVCGNCDMCKAGLTSHCRNRTVLGISGRNGCFADLFVLPEVNLVPVPDRVDDDVAVFAEPLAAAIQGVRQLHIIGRPYITILGDGKLGLLCAQVMAQQNASVRVVGKHQQKMNLCEKWGIKHRHIDDIGKRQDQDIVVDCTGSQTGLEIAMKLVRPRGKILLKTTIAPTKGIIDLAPLVINEIEVIGSRCGPINLAIDMLAKGYVDVLSLINRRFKLTDGIAALQYADQPDIIKILMDI